METRKRGAGRVDRRKKEDKEGKEETKGRERGRVG